MIERIKQEIEQRISDNTFGAKLELIDLLSFIESLEKEQEKQESSIFTKAEMWVARNYPKTVGEEFDKLVTVYLSGIAEGQRTVDDATKIKGWVARDKAEEFEEIGYLHLFASKPHREYGCSWIGTCCYLCLDKTMFPDLKWEDEPIKVELTISQVKTE